MLIRNADEHLKRSFCIDLLCIRPCIKDVDVMGHATSSTFTSYPDRSPPFCVLRVCTQADTRGRAIVHLDISNRSLDDGSYGDTASHGGVIEPRAQICCRGGGGWCGISTACGAVGRVCHRHVCQRDEALATGAKQRAFTFSTTHELFRVFNLAIARFFIVCARLTA